MFQVPFQGEEEPLKSFGSAEEKKFLSFEKIFQISHGRPRPAALFGRPGWETSGRGRIHEKMKFFLKLKKLIFSSVIKLFEGFWLAEEDIWTLLDLKTHI